ncbi:MAG: hypothetical protein WEB88_13055 [Gemmatimonadota bacterium]
MSRLRLAAWGLFLAGTAALTACAPEVTASETYADVLRATALRVRSAHPELSIRVLDRAPGSAADPFTWDARQALTTAGFELVDASEPAASAQHVLRFSSVERTDSVWDVVTRLRGPGVDTADVRWRVRCVETCMVLDSVRARP